MNTKIYFSFMINIFLAVIGKFGSGGKNGGETEMFVLAPTSARPVLAQWCSGELTSI